MWKAVFLKSYMKKPYKSKKKRCFRPNFACFNRAPGFKSQVHIAGSSLGSWTSDKYLHFWHSELSHWTNVPVLTEKYDFRWQLEWHKIHARFLRSNNFTHSYTLLKRRKFQISLTIIKTTLNKLAMVNQHRNHPQAHNVVSVNLTCSRFCREYTFHVQLSVGSKDIKILE